MRKSDKLKNFKKVNLIAEQRYLVSKGIITESFHDEFEKYEKIMYIGEPMTFNNGKTVKYGDVGEYIGTEGGEECWVAFPASSFATTFSNIKKIDEQYSELEEGIFGKMFGGDKANEANKQMVISEISKFNFESLFYQPGEGQVLRTDIAEKKVADAARAMPTLAKMLPYLFELKGGYFSHAYLEVNGTLHKGVIPSCFESIRGGNDIINNQEARKRVISFLD